MDACELTKRLGCRDDSLDDSCRLKHYQHEVLVQGDISRDLHALPAKLPATDGGHIIIQVGQVTVLQGFVKFHLRQGSRYLQVALADEIYMLSSKWIVTSSPYAARSPASYVFGGLLFNGT